MKIIWFDCESTGLDPLTCQVLEVCAMVSDFNDPFNARFLYEAVLPLAPSAPCDLPSAVLEMHTKNGLLSECGAWSTKRRELVDIELSKWIDAVEEQGVFPALGGSSIHFDWNFIVVHFPSVAARMSHRPGDIKRYDVSVLKLYCQSMGMEPLSRGDSVHRARQDVLRSIELGKECTEWLKRNLGHSPNVHTH